MVYLKVTDGFETRKFEVTPGELTYDQLKEQLGEKFPNIGKDLSFVYRDTDGDVITLSSDTELQSVLTQLPADSVWKLQIKGSKRQPQNQHHQQQRHTQRSSRGVSLFDSLFDHLWSPSLWHNFDQQLRETEGLLQHARCRASCGQACQQPSATVEKPAAKTNAKLNTEPTATAQPDTATNDPNPKDSGFDDEVKSKNTEKESPAKEPEWEQWVIRSYQPRLVFTPFGLSTVLRPRTYHVYWSQPSEENEKSSEKPATTSAEGTNETPSQEPAATANSGAAETQPEVVPSQNTETEAAEQ